MVYTHKNKMTCSSSVTVELDGEIIKNIEFVGGCNGNLQGISKLCIGQNARDVIERVRGIRCGFKPTSCPDQLAEALTEALNQ